MFLSALTFLDFRNWNGIFSWILTVPMARPSAGTWIQCFICLIRAVASLWLLIWLRVTVVRHLEKCLRGTFCRNLTSTNHGRANDVDFPSCTGGWLRLEAKVLCTGQPWDFPHVERCKSVVLISNGSDLWLLLACKLIYIYTDCVQNTITEGLATPVHISTEWNSITLNSSWVWIHPRSRLLE